MSLTIYIDKVTNGIDLSREEMNNAATIMFEHTENTADIINFLIALHNKGEAVSEIVGLVDVILKYKISITPVHTRYFDNCGTGGDKLNTFNISTTTAFVLAGAGINVAKHGNRKISSQSGSSDVLEALNIRIPNNALQVEEQLQRFGITFLHAPNFHPKLGAMREIRSAIPHATIFNLVGPLTNPLPLHAQLVGINRSDMVETYALALKELGRERAIVVSGAKGLDEASLFGNTTIALLNDGDISIRKITAETVGLSPTTLADIQGGTAQHNASIVKDVLSGKESAYYHTVLLNAALGIIAYGLTADLKEAVEIAKQSIHSGNALAKLTALQQFQVMEDIAQ